MDIERVDYGDAIKQLSEQHKIPMDDFQNKWESSPEYKSEKEKTKRIIKLAQEFFVWALKSEALWWASTQDSAGYAYNYLVNQRSLSESLISQLWLGYAPSQSQVFFAYFAKHWFTTEDLVQAGLAKVREGTKEVYAFFRDRLTIPIRDQIGNVIAFGARALHKDQEPKYLNSSESLIYDKSNTLYGIDHLKLGIKEHKAIIVVEWYFDVIALTQGGFDIGVATCGTSLTAQHITTLKRYSDTIYFLFDNDQAGNAATLRWLAIAYAKGMYPKIISLSPNGDKSDAPKDIDELVRDNQHAHEEIQALIDTAKEGFDRALHYFANNYVSLSPIEKERATNQLFDLIESVESITVQHHFLTSMDEKMLKRQGESEKSYKVYRAQKKKLWPKKNLDIKISDTEKKHKEGKRLERLWSLLHNDFWKKINIDATWIESLRFFIDSIHLQEPENLSYNEIEMEREQELSLQEEGSVEDSTLIIKKLLWPLLSELQKTAITQAAPGDKQTLLEIAKKLR